jgi:hypothetical protein
VPGEIGFRPQRGLILVSKLLQYVVNGLTFEPGHELYDFNDFVVAQVTFSSPPRCSAFFLAFTTQTDSLLSFFLLHSDACI